MMKRTLLIGTAVMLAGSATAQAFDPPEAFSSKSCPGFASAFKKAWDLTLIEQAAKESVARQLPGSSFQALCALSEPLHTSLDEVESTLRHCLVGADIQAYRNSLQAIFLERRHADETDKIAGCHIHSP